MADILDIVAAGMAQLPDNQYGIAGWSGHFTGRYNDPETQETSHVLPDSDNSSICTHRKKVNDQYCKAFRQPDVPDNPYISDGIKLAELSQRRGLDHAERPSQGNQKP